MALGARIEIERVRHTSWVRIDLPKAVERMAAEQNATDDDDIGRDDQAKANVDSDLVIGKSRLWSLALQRIPHTSKPTVSRK